ncbi:MAG: ATP-binding protein [Caulobacteraceae bacterium]
MSRAASRRRSRALALPFPQEAAANRIEALPWPVAFCEADGVLTQVNAAWREVGLPIDRAPDGPAMFAAFREAGKGGRGVACIRGDAANGLMHVAVATAGRFCLLLAPPPSPAESIRRSPDRPSAADAPDPLARRNRLEAIGQLAGGVAHDFNNLLTAIGLRADELLQRHPLGDPAYDNLAQIRATVDRAASLANQLLAFAAKAPRRREELDLGELLSNLEVLLRRLLREDVRLEMELGENLPRILADPGQLETVIVNLVVNAGDAIAGGERRGRGGGRVRLSAGRVSRARALDLGHLAAAGAMALIEVADDGPGIAAEVIDAIFEPFFTTKAPGKGTGLGLATVYGIIEQSGGWIEALSPPEGGALFRILLPEHQGALTLQPPTPPVAPAARPRDHSGAGRILFVEDEDLVRGVAARLLRARGYEVIEAADGEAALALAREHAGAISLLISDVVMPGLDGPALLKAARPHLGDIPVLFVSGYAEAEFSDLLEGERGVAFLPKPLDFKTLAERVKQALARL